MKVDNKTNTTIIKDFTEPIDLFCSKVLHENHLYKNKNLIVDVSHIAIEIKDFKLFSDIAKHQKSAKKSFVIIAKDIDFNKTPAKLTVVPTMLEAHDIIEMEEIERDLGF